jgi:hypothetical protein
MQSESMLLIHQQDITPAVGRIAFARSSHRGSSGRKLFLE